MLDLHGKITGGNADTVITDTVRRLATLGVRKVVLKFAFIPHMDSVGVSAVVRSHLTLRQGDGQLKLLQLPRRIADLFALTRLTTVFEIFDRESDAITSFDPPRAAPSSE